MMPNWKDAPEWAQFRATDCDGTTYWHELRPVWVPEVGEWQSEGEIRVACEVGNSLERRPCSPN